MEVKQQIIPQPNLPAPKVRPTFGVMTPNRSFLNNERVSPEKRCWSYSIEREWKLIEHPLGSESDGLPVTRSMLERAGFQADPCYSLGGDDNPWRLEVFARASTVEELVIVYTPVGEQLVLVKGFPSLVRLLGDLKDLVTAEKPKPRSEPKAEPKVMATTKKKR